MAWPEEQLAEDHIVVMGANTYRTMSQIVAEEEATPATPGYAPPANAARPPS